jgi:hypothetical protein
VKPTLKSAAVVLLLVVFVVEPLWDLVYHTNVLRGWFGHFIGFLSLHPMRWAGVALLLVYALYWAFAGTPNLLKLALGADQRLSTSKFQFLVWTVPVLFVFIALALGRQNAALANLPSNVLIVLGFNLTTFLGAKAITVSYLTSNRISKKPSDEPDYSLRFLVSNDSGNPELSKTQMLAWTAIAIGAFLFDFFINYGRYLHCGGGFDKRHCFPDIDTALMVLMGLGQGAYLGGKLVAADPPQVTSIAAAVTVNQLTVTVQGKNLDGGTITANDIAASGPTWADASATAVFPNPLGGATLKSGDSITIGGQINNVTVAATRIQIT